MPETKDAIKIVADNRKAFHDYFILERYEAGMVLRGTEIKAAREGKVQLREGYAEILSGEVWLMNAHISPYSHGNINNHEPMTKRKLLLHKREIEKLAGKTQEKGLTLIPLKMYLKNGLLKCELGVAKGKKHYDKRAAEQAKSQEKEARQMMNARNLRNRTV